MWEQPNKQPHDAVKSGGQIMMVVAAGLSVYAVMREEEWGFYAVVESSVVGACCGGK